MCCRILVDSDYVGLKSVEHRNYLRRIPLQIVPFEAAMAMQNRETSSGMHIWRSAARMPKTMHTRMAGYHRKAYIR